jgi:hypothetical protein
MDDSKYTQLFPTKIPLGKSPATLFLSGVPGLDQIPDDGYILIQIQKQPQEAAPAEAAGVGGLPEDTGAPASASAASAPTDNGVELAVLSVCLPEAAAEDDGGDKYSWLDKAAKKLGVKTKGGDEMESPAEAASETPADEEKEG